MNDRFALLERVCLLFAAVGLLLAAAGDTWVFAGWRSAVEAELFPGLRGAPGLAAFQRTTDAILGGSIVGKWVAAWFLVRYGLRKGARWAWLALLLGHATWFLLDCAVSLSLGAISNVLWINLIPGLGFLALLIAARPRRWVRPPTYRPTGPGWVVLWLVSILMVVGGALLTLSSRWPGTGIYTRALVGQFGAEPIIVVWEAFAYGLIGATFAGHFAMLAVALRAARGATWVLRATIISVLAWFLVDSVGCAFQRAWFNVALVNLPALIAVGVPFWVATREKPSTSLKR